MKYSVFGSAGTANTTAATSGIISINNAASTTARSPRIYEWEIGPAANSVDMTYAVRVKRNTTAGTYTAVTPSPLDPTGAASVMAAGVAQTAAGGTGVELGRFGFHQRGGYRWVSIPGGENVVTGTFSFGIFVEYTFAQDTSVNSANLYYDE